MALNVIAVDVVVVNVDVVVVFLYLCLFLLFLVMLLRIVCVCVFFLSSLVSLCSLECMELFWSALNILNTHIHTQKELSSFDRFWFGKLNGQRMFFNDNVEGNRATESEKERYREIETERCDAVMTLTHNAIRKLTFPFATFNGLQIKFSACYMLYGVLV